MKKNLITLILLLILAGGISYYLKNSVIIGNPKPTIVMNTTSTSVSDGSTASTMKVKIALLGMQTDSEDKNNFIGCDVVVMQEREVPYSTMALSAALEELFSKKDVWMPSELTPGNFISSQNELFFDKVIIENAIAKIYLTGKIGPLNGVCDNPRLRIQLEETALQFPTVQMVEFYLNGVKTDLIFSEKGI